jgi:hypothetical protein
VWQMLERLPQWEMDMFELKTKLGRHSVVAVVGMTVMCKLTLLDNLKINPQVGYAATTYNWAGWVGNCLAGRVRGWTRPADTSRSNPTKALEVPADLSLVFSCLSACLGISCTVIPAGYERLPQVGGQKHAGQPVPQRRARGGRTALCWLAALRSLQVRVPNTT